MVKLPNNIAIQLGKRETTKKVLCFLHRHAYLAVM